MRQSGENGWLHVISKLRTVATTRFSAAPRGGTLAGKVRLPKTRCLYAALRHRLIGELTFPVGVEPFNQDLGPAAGLCSFLRSPLGIFRHCASHCWLLQHGQFCYAVPTSGSYCEEGYNLIPLQAPQMNLKSGKACCHTGARYCGAPLSEHGETTLSGASIPQHHGRESCRPKIF